MVLSPYRVNAGAADDLQDDSGETWTRDMGFWNTGVANAINADVEIDGTTTRDAIYRTSRTDQDSGEEMKWSFPLTNGSYRVVLHFAEHIHNSAGARRFDVGIEGNRVLQDFDIYVNAGNRRNRVVVRNFIVTVTDGLLEVEFLHRPGRSDPTVMAIEVTSTEALQGEVLTTPGQPFIVEVN
ncbi:MAG: malectin domain-containing carbohydrate-binding protein [Myxococcota bacterium]|nr:malectin domain-containing carbohydrate-binding protein [Myxococcota bacterium]